MTNVDMYIYTSQESKLIHLFILGKWVKVDFFEVPEKFFQHLLGKTKAAPYSVKETTHVRAPIYSSSAKRIIYRGYSEENFRRAIEEQKDVQLQLSTSDERE